VFKVTVGELWPSRQQLRQLVTMAGQAVAEMQSVETAVQDQVAALPADGAT